MAFNYFNRTTTTNATPTAASGSVSFTVSDPTQVVTGLAKVFPQHPGRYDPDDGTVTGAQVVNITNISGSSVTATLGVSNTTAQPIFFGFYILCIGSVSELNMSATYSASSSVLNKNLWTIVFNTDSTSGAYVRGHYIDVYQVPAAGNAAAMDSLAVYANHTSGNASTTLRAIVAVTYQNLSGNTIAGSKAIEAGPFCYGGTITQAISFDAVNDITGGAITQYIGLRIRAHVGTTAPVSNIAIDSIEGENRFVGNVIIGEDSSPIAPLYIRGVGFATGGVSSVIRAEQNHTASGNGQNMYSLLLSGGTLAKGAFTGLVYAAMRVIHPAVTGAGTIDIAIGIALDLPTIGTDNYYMSFATADATDPTGGGGAATGRLKVYVGGVTHYLAYY